MEAFLLKSHPARLGKIQVSHKLAHSNTVLENLTFIKQCNLWVS